MSRIYPAKGASQARAPKLALDERSVGAPNPGRAKGGLAWISGSAGGGAEHQTDYERREAEARAIVATARVEAERIQKEAYLKGFEQGEAAGRRLAAQKIEPVLRALKTLLDGLADERKNVIEKHEAELVRIAFLLGSTVLHEEIASRADAVMPVLRAALQKVIKANHVTIKVSPYDLDLVQQSMSESALGPDWLREEIKIEADFEIARGGCKVFTDSGEIDATIETQLHLLKAILWNQ